MHSVPQLNGSVKIIPIDTSSPSQRYLVQVDGEREFEISETLHDVIALIDGVRTTGEIAAEFARQTGKLCNKSDIEKIIDTYLVPYNIIANQNNKNWEPQQASYLSARIRLISKEALRPVTSVSKLLFVPWIFFPTLGALLVFHFYLYGFVDKPALSLTSITVSEGVVIYCLLLFAILLHELGHASACRYQGANPGEIGFGLYLYFPVFYSDVTDVWRLRRTQRAVVDLGGIYFQLLCVPLLLWLYLTVEHRLFIYTIYLLNFSVVTSLNPFLRFDGYWLISDITGIPNLRKRSREALSYLFQKFTKGHPAPPSPALGVHPTATYILLCYSILSNLFFVFFAFYVLILSAELLSTYPSMLVEFITNVQNDLFALNISPILQELNAIIPPTLMILALGFMAYRGVRFALRFIRRPLTQDGHTSRMHAE